ncbi:MAG TPA: NfeD family protein [Rhizomicrobium sp.]|nr:NfeD family protein [Rhizomicrobium sp.]
MDWLLQNPFALWLAIGAVLLAVEVATGSGWLLWPAASAAVMGVLGLVLHFELNLQLAIFALLTIVTTLAGRRLFPRAVLTGGDINDTSSRMAGLDGVAAGDFQGRQGRVFVDGKEWAAELEGDGALASGMRVIVVGVKGARLTVKPG